MHMSAEARKESIWAGRGHATLIGRIVDARSRVALAGASIEITDVSGERALHIAVSDFDLGENGPEGCRSYLETARPAWTPPRFAAMLPAGQAHQ